MQVLNMRHTVLHRQAILLRASTEKLTQHDSELLEVSHPHGFNMCACKYAVMGCQSLKPCMHAGVWAA